MEVEVITLNLVVQRGWGVADWQAAGFVWLPGWVTKKGTVLFTTVVQGLELMLV